MTKAYNKFYINGEWVEPQGSDTLEVINPKAVIDTVRYVVERVQDNAR